MSKFLNRHSEGWQCAQDTVFNRLVSDVKANTGKHRSIKTSHNDANEEIIAQDKFELYEAAILNDELTGLFNTNYFSEALYAELRRCKRYKRPFSLIFITIDRMAELQERYGNLVSCQILRQEADTIKRSIREVDLAFRIAIDQFVVICPETYSSRAITLGERIRNRTRSKSISGNTDSIIPSVSIGISSFPTHGRQEKDLIIAACRFMRTAQKSGGNNVLTA